MLVDTRTSGFVRARVKAAIGTWYMLWHDVFGRREFIDFDEGLANPFRLFWFLHLCLDVKQDEAFLIAFPGMARKCWTRSVLTMRVNQLLSVSNEESQRQRAEVLAAKGNFAEIMGNKLTTIADRAMDTFARILKRGYVPEEGDKIAVRLAGPFLRIMAEGGISVSERPAPPLDALIDGDEAEDAELGDHDPRLLLQELRNGE